MIISVLPPPAGCARFALFLARIVPRFRCEDNDLLGLVALYLRVDWKPRIHSCDTAPLNHGFLCCKTEPTSMRSSVFQS